MPVAAWSRARLRRAPGADRLARSGLRGRTLPPLGGAAWALEGIARRLPVLATVVALAAGLAIGGVLAISAAALPPAVTGGATPGMPSPGGPWAGPGSEPPGASSSQEAPPLLSQATPPLTSGRTTQTFDLDPMGGSPEGWTRSGPEVGIAAFPTSVDRSLGIPVSVAGDWACRAIPGIADGRTRVFADLLLTREPLRGSPAVALGRSTDSPGMLVWRGGRLELADATDQAGPVLHSRAWYRIAIEVDPATRSLTWELAALEPWSHLTRQTAEIDPDAIAEADGLCVFGPRGSPGATLYLDDVRVEPVEGV